MDRLIIGFGRLKNGKFYQDSIHQLGIDLQRVSHPKPLSDRTLQQNTPNTSNTDPEF